MERLVGEAIGSAQTDADESGSAKQVQPWGVLEWVAFNWATFDWGDTKLGDAKLGSGAP